LKRASRDVLLRIVRKFLIESSDKMGKQLKSAPAGEERRREGWHCFYVRTRTFRISLILPTKFSATTVSGISASAPRFCAPTATTV
jgi:hypothetical protein